VGHWMCKDLYFHFAWCTSGFFFKAASGFVFLDCKKEPRLIVVGVFWEATTLTRKGSLTPKKSPGLLVPIMFTLILYFDSSYPIHTSSKNYKTT
jgi:hypothetical protein